MHFSMHRPSSIEFINQPSSPRNVRGRWLVVGERKAFKKTGRGKKEIQRLRVRIRPVPASFARPPLGQRFR
jgi:hypothetical protein